MRKFSVILFLLLSFGKLYCQNYIEITFSGEGAFPETIIVENLSNGNTIQIGGSDVLHLMLKETSIYELENERFNIKVFPNPMDHSSNFEFYNSKHGVVKIILFNTSGKEILQYSNVLSEGMHSFSFNDLNAGSYILTVQTNTDLFTGRIISIGRTKSAPSLTRFIDNTKYYFKEIHSLKKINSIVEMDFELGNVLKFTAIASGYIDVTVYSSPIIDQTITFVFNDSNFGQPCPDLPTFSDSRDGNLYPTVQIGDQCWFAKNLSYLPSVVGPSTSSSSTPYYYVYDYDGSNITEAKATSNFQVYGVLYNWSAAFNACPYGWRLPSKSEFEDLISFFSVNNANAFYALKDGGLSGFNAFFGGFLGSNQAFGSIGGSGYWWSLTEDIPTRAWSLFLGNESEVSILYSGWVNNGYSIRCVKN